MTRVKKITGQIFGRLTVVRDAKKRELRGVHRQRNRYVLCKCSCGRQTAVRVDHLRNGKTRSCGCLSREIGYSLGWETIINGDEWRTGLLTESQVAEQSARTIYDAAPAESDPRAPIERRWDMKPGEYQRRLTAQEGLCYICQQPPLAKPLNVDHDHATGKIRGLLCTPCNHGLGMFKDDLTRLVRALKYLSDGGVVLNA